MIVTDNSRGIPSVDSGTGSSDLLKSAHGVSNTLSRIAKLNAPGFPLFRDKGTDQWVLSPGGSWMGGFWCGSWYLRAKLYGHSSVRKVAAALLEELAPKLHSDTVFRSAIFWYGTAPGMTLFNDRQARDLAAQAAKAISRSYNSQWGCYPVGGALGGGESGVRTLNIDAFAPLIQLLQFGDESVRNTAKRHAEATLAHMTSSSGSFYTNVTLGQYGVELAGLPGQWARGQSWGLLGLATAALLWGDPYLAHAEKLADHWWQAHADQCPPDLEADKAGLQDPSASLIAALAMFKLKSRSSLNINWERRARHIVNRLLQSEHFHFNESENEARFTGCCYRNKRGQRVLGESVWGYFFMLQALLIQEKIIDPQLF